MSRIGGVAAMAYLRIGGNVVVMALKCGVMAVFVVVSAGNLTK